MQANILSQCSSMFADFCKQLESKFSKIDDRLNNLNSSQFSFVPPSQGTVDVSQDVSNVSFSAHTSVAVFTGHNLAKASYTPRQVSWRSP